MNGKMDKLKGRVKQAAGRVTGNKRLELEGKGDEVRGNVKEGIDKAVNRFRKETERENI